MTLREKQSIFAHNVAVLIDYIYANQHSVTFGDAYRSPEAAELYAKQGKGIKKSLHCSRLAIDLMLFSPDGKFLQDKKDYEKFGMFWEKLHPSNRAGCFFKTLVDCVHFEMQA